MEQVLPGWEYIEIEVADCVVMAVNVYIQQWRRVPDYLAITRQVVECGPETTEPHIG